MRPFSTTTASTFFAVCDVVAIPLIVWSGAARSSAWLLAVASIPASVRRLPGPSAPEQSLSRPSPNTSGAPGWMSGRLSSQSQLGSTSGSQAAA